MKKLLIGLSGVVLLSLAVVLLVSAQGKTDEGKKAQTEMSKDCSGCPSASTCPEAAAEKAAAATKACCPEGASKATATATEGTAPCCASKAETKTN